MIRKCGHKWCLYNKTGTKLLSKHDTKIDALHRERQIVFFKNRAKKRGKK